MKKLIAIIAILALATSAFATESDPSETVGFVKLQCNAGDYTPFALPFTFYVAHPTPTMALDDIIGAQFTGGVAPFLSDQIKDINTGASGWYNTGTGSWTLANFTANHGNYANVLSTHPAVDMYLAGQVDQSVIVFGTMAAGNYNAVGIREAGEVSVADLDLVSSGFTGGAAPFQSDQIKDMNTGNSAWYNTGTSTWVGGLTNIIPGHVYYIYVLSGHTPFDWTYNPTGAKASKSTGENIKINVNTRK